MFGSHEAAARRSGHVTTFLPDSVAFLGARFSTIRPLIIPPYTMSLPLARIRPMSLTRVRAATAIRPTLLRPTAFHFSRSLASPLTSSLSSRSFVSTTHILNTANPQAFSQPNPRTSDHSGSSSNADETKKQQQQKSNGPESETEPKSAYAKFKALSRKYGSWAIGMYFVLSTIDFSLCFLLVHSLGAERIEPLMDSAKEFYRSKRYGVEEAERMRIEDEKEREEEMAAEKKDGKQGKSGSGWFGKTFWAEAVLAYTIHKTALLPFRAGLTVAWTPKFVGWLAKRGWVGKVRSSLFSL